MSEGLSVTEQTTPAASDGSRMSVKQMEFNGETFSVDYRDSRRPFPIEPGFDLSKIGGMAATAHGFCAPFNPRTYEAAPGITCDQDVEVTLRDGTKIYVDIFRPSKGGPFPVLVSWSAYGKRPGDGMSEWQVFGVTPGTISTMSKFESPDPAYWCHYGYAVANVDPRGVGYSEGDIEMFTPQDALDGYDFIEWVAQQPWCTGKVGLSGNSFVAMTQLRIAAQQPPHLAAIAPWEASTDIYRDSVYEGGIPALTFNEFVVSSLTGQGRIDDQVANARRYPLMHPYWESKVPDFSKITVPVYMAAGWSHFHLRGSINAFRRIRSRKKWLRAHREFEWPDAYNRDNLADLRLFFDRYLKDIHNCWESTPRVRLQVMDAYDVDYATYQTDDFFPSKRTEYRKYHLDASVSGDGHHAMSPEPVAAAASTFYEADTGQVIFDYTFGEETEIVGYMMARLWVEADGHDDMDLFLTVKKADADGNFIPWSVLSEPHPGAWGKMRVSHRELDEKLSTSFNPVQAHHREQKLSPGEIVPIDVEIVPSARIWHAGERLRIEIAGRYIRDEWMEPLSWETDNKGRHVIHTGGRHDSYLQVPMIPPRLKVAGRVVY